MKSCITLIVCLTLTLPALAQNRVLSLDGDGDYVQLPQPIIDLDEFSIEAWYLMVEEGGGIEQQSFIFSQRDVDTGCDHSAVVLVAKGSPSQPNSTFNCRTHTGCSEVAMAPYAGSGQWHHLVGVKTTNELRLYADGQLVATTPFTQDGSLAVNILTTELGRHYHDYDAFGYFNGMMDEVRIWSYALSAAEINARMKVVLEGDEEGLLAYWNFDEATANDLSGNGHNGTFIADAETVQMAVWSDEEPLWGDLNNDGYRDITDVLALVSYIMGR